MDGPVDIILLTHDRLEHLEAMVDALEQRTRHPYRLTIVDNASEPEVRTWLAENRHRFERVIFRPGNEHVPGFNHGIRATTSDPYVLSDPDIIVPDLEPCWLTQMLALVERHPDFGLIGMGLEQFNRPPVLDPFAIDPATVVDDELVETGIGTTFQFIRRAALVTDYRSDGQACTNVRRAGLRVGWSKNLLGIHLGWDDFKLYPGHLLSKGLDYGVYREVGLLRRPPTLGELALAAPVLAHTRSLGIPDAAVLELSWSGPVLATSAPDSTCVERPQGLPLPFDAGAAAAVVLVDPPAQTAPALVRDASRVATSAVIALAPLDAFAGAVAPDLAAPGWTGRELPGPSDVATGLSALGDADPELARVFAASVLEQRERWLTLFAAGAFGDGRRRLWIWEPATAPAAAPAAVALDPARVKPWEPEPMQPTVVAAPTLLQRIWSRADLADRLDVWRGRLRRRLGR